MLYDVALTISVTNSDHPIHAIVECSRKVRYVCKSAFVMQNMQSVDGLVDATQLVLLEAHRNERIKMNSTFIFIFFSVETVKKDVLQRREYTTMVWISRIEARIRKVRLGVFGVV